MSHPAAATSDASRFGCNSSCDQRGIPRPSSQRAASRSTSDTASVSSADARQMCIDVAVASREGEAYNNHEVIGILQAPDAPAYFGRCDAVGMPYDGARSRRGRRDEDMLKVVRNSVALGLLALAIEPLAEPSAATPEMATSAQEISRGEYLAHAADCS